MFIKNPAEICRVAQVEADESPGVNVLIAATNGGLTTGGWSRVHGRAMDVTRKEFQILGHFLESPRRAFSRQNMLNRVWGDSYALEEHALDVHIHNLRQETERNPAHLPRDRQGGGLQTSVVDAPEVVAGITDGTSDSAGLRPRRCLFCINVIPTRGA